MTFGLSVGEPLGGRLIYRESELSFDFEVGDSRELRGRVGRDGLTSLSIGTLQLEIDVESGVVLYVWGLHPRTKWESGSCRPDLLAPAVVRARGVPPLTRGVSVPVSAVGEWDTVFDRDSGWLRVVRDLAVDDDVQAMIASGTALGLSGGLLNSVWLRPAFIRP